MARKVTKKGEAPKVETIVAATQPQEVKLEWKMSKYDNGLVEWRQTKAVPESRDLSIHTFNERDGWCVTSEVSRSSMYGYKTPEDAMRECEAIVRHRLSPQKTRQTRTRT